MSLQLTNSCSRITNCERKGRVGLNEDESYQLSIVSNKITINATTDLGALHGLETLLQLMQNNGSSFYFPAEVTDSPRFTWRD
jgi:hexosaminidase